MPMALESWLTKVRSAMSSARSSSGGSGAPPAGPRTKQSTVGILAFEVASLMSKLLHLWRAVGDAAVARLRHETIHLHGVRRVVSDDDYFLLGLARAELVDTLRAAADSVAALAARCADPSLRDFRYAFLELADTGRDRHRWAAPSWKEMDARASKMDKQVAATAALRRAMEELAEAEHGLRKLLVLQCAASSNGNGNGGGHRRSLSASKISVAAEQQQLVFSKKQEVKHLKQTSLWGCTFDAAVASLARAAFTTLARIKAVFGAGQEQRHPPLYRSLTLSSAVHPSADARSESDTSLAPPPPVSRKSMSMEELLLFDIDQSSFASKPKRQCCGFLEDSSAALTPPAGTLGAAALAPRYAGLVISIERMARSPRLVGPDERDELYGMLTASVRAQLRARLRGAVPAADPVLAGQWRAALAGILEWLAPMAHATVRWQAERSLEQRGPAAARGGTGSVLLLQTLQFAERDRVDAAVVELLVGLNYVWRFEKEMMSCRTLFAVHHRQQLPAAMMELAS
ncbi:protein PSK SIMULATOR 1-like [Miscanthus floridulus]|uniref:protein PSK SIMULATOR 1-like n=1 Tax=Miscanthus floridulus TaxID=154761 RepID=UPI00345A3593